MLTNNNGKESTEKNKLQNKTLEIIGLWIVQYKKKKNLCMLHMLNKQKSELEEWYSVSSFSKLMKQVWKRTKWSSRNKKKINKYNNET